MVEFVDVVCVLGSVLCGDLCDGLCGVVGVWGDWVDLMEDVGLYGLFLDCVLLLVFCVVVDLFCGCLFVFCVYVCRGSGFLGGYVFRLLLGLDIFID